MKSTRILFLILFSPLIGFAQWWVAKNGFDENNGLSDKPFATVAMAVRKARELRRLLTHGHR